MNEPQKISWGNQSPHAPLLDFQVAQGQPENGQKKRNRGSHRQAFFRPPVKVAPIFPVLLLFALPILAGISAAAEEAGTGSVSGRIIAGDEAGAVGGLQVGGVTVVLLRFTLDDSGKPQGGPISRQLAAEDGSYEFTGVTIEPGAAYQLGTRVGGRLASSAVFTFPEGGGVVRQDLTVSGEVQEDLTVSGEARETLEGLHFRQVVVGLEPGRGEVMVTEVLHIENPSQRVVAVERPPLEIPIPAAAENLEMIRFNHPRAAHERVGGRLMITGNLVPGTTTIAYRYFLPAWLGKAVFRKRYPLPVAELLVLSPSHNLKISGDGLAAVEDQTIEEIVYRAWGRSGIPAETAFRVTATGFPIRQEILLLPALGFFVVMAGVVGWFFRKRLGPPKKGTAGGATSRP